jgi:hypothetical protein
MNAILLTVFVGFVLVNFFIILFLRYRGDAESSSPERDSLLPLEDEFSIPATARRLDGSQPSRPSA